MWVMYLGTHRENANSAISKPREEKYIKDLLSIDFNAIINIENPHNPNIIH